MIDKFPITAPIKEFFYKLTYDSRYKDYTIIITGVQSTLGSTYLTQALQKHGYNAIEITEYLLHADCVQIAENVSSENWVIEDTGRKIIFIELNEKISFWEENK